MVMKWLITIIKLFWDDYPYPSSSLALPLSALFSFFPSSMSFAAVVVVGSMHKCVSDELSVCAND